MSGYSETVTLILGHVSGQIGTVDAIIGASTSTDGTVIKRGQTTISCV